MCRIFTVYATYDASLIDTIITLSYTVKIRHIYGYTSVILQSVLLGQVIRTVTDILFHRHGLCSPDTEERLNNDLNNGSSTVLSNSKNRNNRTWPIDFSYRRKSRYRQPQSKNIDQRRIRHNTRFCRQCSNGLHMIPLGKNCRIKFMYMMKRNDELREKRKEK